MREIGQYELTVEHLDKDKFPKDGILVPESDYGLAEIYLHKDGYEVGEIPTYGGEVSFTVIKTAEEVVETIQSWT